MNTYRGDSAISHLNVAAQPHGIAETIPGYFILERLRDSYPHIIYRARRNADNAAVVIKTLADKYPQKEALATMRREHRITQQLQGRGVIQVYDLVPYGHGNLAIVIEHFGVSLKSHLATFEQGRVPLEEFFRIAIGLSRILGHVHEEKIVHKDLGPSNILIEPQTGELRLIDFGASSELSREHLDTLSLSGRVVATLAYMSPEITGRINRDVDFRTDYYSLGVLFYQMLTGRLPYEAADPLEWVHCIISREAVPANLVNNAVPEVLAQIVARLMEKNAEDRYGSGHGLEADLEQCRNAVAMGRPDTTFPLARHDVNRRFQIPQKLYGRDVELGQLEAFFKNASEGAVEFCLVAGYSGVGKTVLVNELGRTIARGRGYLISGKFEQFRQNAAYAALATAFRDLMRQILGEPEERLTSWRSRILQALGASAQLVVDLVPELALIIGPQPPVQELSPAETQIRFQILFLSFVKVFAGAEHPFAIFLDDLQWSDIPTLNLLSRLATTHELSHVLIIGAYRDNEVDMMHPLSLTLRDIEKKRDIEILSLGPLSLTATHSLTKDTLLRDDAPTQELSRVLFEKTGGNPFFTTALMQDLKDRDVIHFDDAAGIWDWDMMHVRAVKYSDNVVDVLVRSQSQLPPATQETLQFAAAIGATFDLKTLAIIRKSTPEETAGHLNEALKAAMVVPLSESYKFFGSENAGDESADDINPSYRFGHDRIQQAAYSLIPDERKQALHLSIGRLLLSHSNAAELDEKLVTVTDHFNEGRALIHSPEEQLQLAKLNLGAGIKAKSSSAYESALRYFCIGDEVIGKGAWQRDYALAWSLNNELQQCYYLTGDREAADKRTDTLLHHAKSTVGKGLVLAARTRQYATTGRMQESIRAAYEGLSILGFPFIQHPTSADVAEEIRLIDVNLAGREIADLISMPRMADEKASIACRLIMEIFPAAFLSGSGEMFPYLVLKSVNIALHYGNSPEAAFSYAAYGMLLCGLFDDTATGYEYGRLGVAMIEEFGDVALKARVIYLYAMFVHHWRAHWATMTPWFRKGIEAGYQSGDLLYLAYSAQDCIIWDPQLDLETASAEHRRMLAIVKECAYQDSYDSGTLFLQMQLNFQGLTKGKFLMTDDAFDEDACVAGMYSRHFMTGISNYHIYKAEIHLLYNDAEGALAHVLEQEQRMASVIALPQAVRICIVAFLTRAMLMVTTGEEERAVFLEKMNEGLRRMTRWADGCKENFEHLRLFMKAELAGICGDMRAAMSHYEGAINAARESGFIRDEAMASEMAAQFLMRNGLEKAADGYLQAAHYGYYCWGAHRKVADMEAAYPALINAKARKGAADAGDSHSLDADSLDITSVFRASQSISEELELQKLLKATLHVLMENAGAQKGLLVEHHDGELIIQAESETTEVTDANGSGARLPSTLINTAIRTKEPIVLRNAAEPNAFSGDSYILKNKPLSVMCVPLPQHGRWPSAIYLENNVMHSAFTESRVKIIKLLASQASISMENARIYEEQEKLLKAQQRFVPSEFLKHLGRTDIARVKLGESVSMEMSVLFSDIRNFTTMVEGLSPQEVIEMLNHYYSHLEKPISAAGGYIDSYAGDGVMALFAVPAQQSVKAGIGMSHALAHFNRTHRKTYPPIMAGSGINTGPLVLGTMGARDRMQCSVLGDTVNLASRIEHLTRMYGSTLLIGEQTFNALSDPAAFSLRKIDRVAVKGKAVAVDLYEVLDAEQDGRRAAKEATKTLLAAAMEAYYERRFAEAYAMFSEGTKRDRQDAVFALFTARTERYMQTAPPHDWRGFEQLQQK